MCRGLLLWIHAIRYLVEATSISKQPRSHGPGRHPLCHLSGAHGFVSVLVRLYRRVAPGQQKCLLPIHVTAPYGSPVGGWAFLDRSTRLELRTSAKNVHLSLPVVT